MTRSTHALRLVIGVTVSSAGGAMCAVRAQVPRGYAVHAAFTLPPDAGPRARRLEVLEDARIAPELRKLIWGGGYADTGYCYAPESAAMQALCASLKQDSLRRVVVRIVTANGRQLDARLFHRELADVTVEHPYGTPRPTYFVTVDYSTGTSTYSGQVTFLLEVREDGLQWVQATDDSTRQSSEIQLAATIKSAWRIVPAKAGPGRDIIELFCQPKVSAVAGDTALVFQNHLVRYHYNGADWRRSERRWSRGMPDWPWECWEGEGSFPPRDSFP